MTKTQLCRAAVDMFREQGFEAVRVEDICRGLDITRGSFYHHFQSKDDLLLFWFDDYAARMAPAIADSAPEAPMARLRRSLETYAEGIASLGCDLLYHTMMADSAMNRGLFVFQPDSRGSSAEIMEAGVALLEEARTCGDLPPDRDPRQLMNGYIWAVTGLILQWKVSGGDLDFMGEIRGLLDTIFR